MFVPYRSEGFQAITTNATMKVLASIPVRENEAVRGTIEIEATQENAANCASFQFTGLCRRKPASNIEVVAVNSAIPLRTDPAWNATLGINAATQSIEVRVTGKAGQTIYWFATVRIMRLKK